jgi:DUF4097 and DUF4098 domain-containing protein YvlB
MPEFPCSGPINVEIDVPSGRVNVVAEERETVLVEVKPFGDSDRDRSAAEETEVSFDGNVLTIEAPRGSGWWSWRNASVTVELHVPSESSARIKTASASISCRGRCGNLNVRSASGDISVGDASGAVRARSASGAIEVGDVGGELEANSASGDITAGKVGGGARLRTASGDIKIGSIGGDVEAKSASGDFEVGSVTRGEVSVRSVSGRVSVGVRPGSGVWLDLNSLSGHIESALESVDGPIDSKDLAIKAHTVSGDIEITRSRQPVAV